MRQVRTGGTTDETYRDIYSYNDVQTTSKGVIHTYGSINKCSFSNTAHVNCIIIPKVNRFFSPCVTFSLTNWTKYGSNWCNPGSCRKLANAADRKDSLCSLRTASQTFSK